jgi:hypothetical protein
MKKIKTNTLTDTLEIEGNQEKMVDPLLVPNALP